MSAFEITRKVSEAQFAHCPDCDLWRSSCDPVPWGLSQTAAMHLRGTGHKMTFYVVGEA